MTYSFLRVGRAPVAALIAGALLLSAAAPGFARERKSSSNECVPLNDSGFYVGVSVPVVSLGNYERPTLVTRTEGFVSKRACDARDTKALVHKNENAVLLRGDIALMTVEGDICADAPKFIFYDARELRDIHGMHGSSLQPMARRIAAALTVAKQTCGAQPEELQFVARRLATLPQTTVYQARIGKLKGGASFDHEDFYSGRLFPLQGARLVSDDAEQERLYWAGEDRRFNAAEDAMHAREMRQAIGAALGMMLLGAAVTLCDPTDPSPDDPACRVR
jgi:hypothetical protein